MGVGSFFFASCDFFGLASAFASSGVTISSARGSSSVILAWAISISSVFCSTDLRLRAASMRLLLLQLGAQLLRRSPARGRDLGDALLHVGVGGLDALALGDRLHQDRRRAPLPRRRRGTPRASSPRRSPRPRRRCRPSSSWRLARVDDRLRVPLDQRGRDRERVALDQLLDQRAAIISRLIRCSSASSSRSRTLSRSPSSVSASPVSLANSSSSAGCFFSRASLMVTRRSTACPASSFCGDVRRAA